MIKMYNAEVLSKFPVVQHFPFGSLFSWDLDPKAEPPPSSAHRSSQPTDRSSRSWVTNRPSVQKSVQVGAPTPGVDTVAHLPGSLGNIQAPWANQGSQRNMTVRTDPPAVHATTSHNRDSVRENSRVQPIENGNSERSKQNDDISMPPPIKAPWTR